MSEQKPTIGRIVHFYLNEDMAVSPAMILNTSETSNPDLLAEHGPRTALLQYRHSHSEGIMVPADNWAILPLESGDLDLKVFGLVRDYRAYSVPFSLEPEPGHWTWPTRA